MRQNDLKSRTSREISRDETSKNAQLLIRAGFVQKLMAGVFSFLPLGMRVLHKIEAIIRDEMLSLGSQEVLLPALHPLDLWNKTGRSESIDVLFKLKGRNDRDLVLGPTHEEVVTPLFGEFIRSWKDLPLSIFQIQTKFRNELRTRSGLLRCREFRMKDMYSFHRSVTDLEAYYQLVQQAYHRVFKRCGLGDKTYLTFASGGSFSKYSHEFQTITENGEDNLFLLPDRNIAVNREVLDEFLEEHQGSLHSEDFVSQRAIEVGNIFQLGTRFSEIFNCLFMDQDGVNKPAIMGCYGIGSTRLMGAVVECSHDKSGIIWPEDIAPYKLHLISLIRETSRQGYVEQLYQGLLAAGVEVLLDDREVSAGEKFVECDLIGIPYRAVVSPDTVKSGSIGFKHRKDRIETEMPCSSLLNVLRAGS